MNNENCEPRIRFTAQRGRQGFELILPRLHVFLAHTHPGGVGGERSALVNVFWTQNLKN